MDGQGTTWHRNIAENFNRLSRVHQRYRQTTDRWQMDGRRHIANTFTFAKHYIHNKKDRANRWLIMSMAWNFVLNVNVRLWRTSWCSVGQGRPGGVEDTAAYWHYPREEPSHQAGTCQPSRFCSPQRNVSVNEMRVISFKLICQLFLLTCRVSGGNC